jgi:PAS domain S-box-containing protein
VKKRDPRTTSSARLRVLLVVLVAMSLVLLALNVVELASPRTPAGVAARSRAYTVGSTAFHVLTLLTVGALWFSLRERERDQLRLRRSEHKHRTIINNAGEAIFLLDRAGRIREWNKAAETLFGSPRRAVLGKPFSEVHLCYGLEIERAMADAEALGRRLAFEFPLRRPHRPDGLIELSLSPLPSAHDPRDVLADPRAEGRFVVIARDVTSERQLEDRITQTEKLAGIGQLAAGIAHQLNTPLGSILLSAQMLADSDLREDDAEDVERIIRQTEQCRQIIKGLLNFARPRSDERQLVPLAETVHETVYLMEKTLRVADIEVDLRAEDPALEVLGNRSELDQVFFNLLVNAVDAMPRGGRVTVTIAGAGPGEILVSFEDTGSGIAPEHRDQVFLPFYTTKDYGKGTGLGLSIVARIMHEHGGRVELAEAEGGGARFLLTFPRPGLGLRPSGPPSRDAERTSAAAAARDDDHEES